MHRVFMSWKGIAAVAIWSTAMWLGTAQHAQAQAQGQAPAAGQHEKKLKDTQEYDLFNSVIKDIQSQNFTKAITDLDTWKTKYPDSDYKDDRLYYYIQAYAGAKQPAKVLDAAGQLMQKDLATVFPKDPKLILGTYYQASIAITGIRDPTPDEIATAQKAAKALLDYAPSYFTAANKPAGMNDAAWAKARTDLEAGPKAALMYIEVAPATKALANKDCATAQTLFTKALQDYPDNAYIAYNLGAAENCIARTDPTKAADIAPKAIYEFVRAAVTDPSLGKTTDPKQVTDFANKIYTGFHGSDEGLDKLKEEAKASALPPAGFTIESAAAVAVRKQNEFAQSNPMLAMWMGIKGQLADTNGEQYFESQLKDTKVPKLRGVVVEGKPACRSKEILVSVPLPDNQGKAEPEISLKLVDADRKPVPLTAKPVPGTEIQWEGVPSAFSKDPFLLTMDTEKSAIEGLKTEPCGPATPYRRKK
ncbi:MAG TPA: hypothetical protein VME43_29335 [Bryobacteraceae bacterium]|nr:hypothetical protein [Bryobacteraceae bacterium]